MFDLRSYRQQADSDAVYTLWQAALGQQWPIAAADFHRLLTESPLYQAGDYFVARQNDQIVGFVAAQIDRSQPDMASIPALFVDPQWQRRGIGTALHAAALAHLRANGTGRVQLVPVVIATFGQVCRLTCRRRDRSSRPVAGILASRATTWRKTCRNIMRPKILLWMLRSRLRRLRMQRSCWRFERREFPHWLGLPRKFLPPTWVCHVAAI